MNTSFSLFLAQADGPPQGGGLTTLIFFGFIFAGMWFLIIAPQRKRQKKHDAMVRAVKTGDEVLTAGGILGVVTNVKDEVVTVKIAEGTKVDLNRSFINNVLKKAD